MSSCPLITTSKQKWDSKNRLALGLVMEVSHHWIQEQPSSEGEKQRGIHLLSASS